MAMRSGPTPTAEPEHGAAGPVDLEGWFALNGRDLPWRRTRNPWAVVVAELMLQQTQVARVLQRWTRFLDRFPTVAICAAAAPGDVIDEWSGLGYNRRAVFLHRMARAVVDEHDGRFPSDLDSLLGLPGVGPYTARAIRVFAFEETDAVLDTNVARILARTSGRTLGRSEAQCLADETLSGDPWTWNQAMLDVGAGYCTARNPRCRDCPFQGVCRWWDDGCPEPDPAVGSAAVSGGQSAFVGSDRQGRGRLVRALRSGPVSVDSLAEVMGWPDDRARAQLVADGLVADGLAQRSGDGYALP